MAELNLDMGRVIIEGEVIATNHRELKKRNAWVVSFDVTDHTGSIRVEGVSDSGMLSSVVDIVIDQLRQEVRL